MFYGNGGTNKIAENVKINIKNFKEIETFLVDKNIDLTIIGPEDPLVNGIVNYLNIKGIKVFGPDKYCSKLEGSKYLQKRFVIRKIYQLQNLKYARI